MLIYFFLDRSLANLSLKLVLWYERVDIVDILVSIKNSFMIQTFV